MTQFASAAFTGTDGTDLATADTNWTEHSSYTAGSIVITDTNRARAGTASQPTCYYHSADPPSADYSVSADLVFKTADGGTARAGVCARCSTSADTMYVARYFGSTIDSWQLHKYVAGTATQLGSGSPETIADESTHTIKLEVDGTTISLLTDGNETPLISVTDSAISDAGKAALRDVGTGTPNNTSGMQWDNFSADTLSGTTEIAASGTVTTGGSATLSVDYALAAVGVAVSGGSAGPSVQVEAAATGIVITGGDATPSASVTIQAAGLVEASGAAGLSADVLMQAAGAALSAGNAELAALIAAQASGAAESSGSASITNGGSGDLAASGGSGSGGAGALDITVTIQASGGSQTDGASLITATVTMTAAGFVQAVGQGALVLHIDIAAFGVAQTGGSAVAEITNGNYPVARLRTFFCVNDPPVFQVLSGPQTFLTVH